MKALSETRHGAWLVIISRHLLQFDVTDLGLSALENLSFAGKCGSLLIKLSADATEKLPAQKVQAHARICGISTSELKIHLELLKALNCIDWDVKGRTYEVLALGRERVLETTSRAFAGTMASEIERAMPAILEECLRRPQFESELALLLTGTLSEVEIGEALGLIRRFELLGHFKAPGATDNLYFNGSQFKKRALDIAKALGALSKDERTELNALIDQVADRPGIPLDEVKTPDRIRAIAIGLGLVEVSEVASVAGSARFVTMPALAIPSIGSKRDQLEDDVFHHAKMLLSSLRFGEVKSRTSRGKIGNPHVLVSRLLERGSVGPCTAIGEDYVVLEAEGVVRTVPATEKAGKQFYMELRRREPAEVVLGLLESGGQATLDPRSLPKELELPLTFTGPEAIRAETARKIVGKDSATLQRFLEQLRT